MARIYGKDSNLINKRRSILADGLFLTYLLLLACISYWVYVFVYHFPMVGANIAAVVLLIIYLILRNPIKKKQWFFIRSDNGLWGENQVLDILKKLPDTYIVFDSAVIPPLTSNLDFIVIGPTGIFTVEVKSHSGHITEDGRQLLRNGAPFQEGDVLHQAYGESIRLSDYLLSKNITFPEIQSLLVFSNRYASVRFGKTPVHGVLVIGATWLVEIILNRVSSALSADQIDKIHKALELVSK